MKSQQWTTIALITLGLLLGVMLKGNEIANSFKVKNLTAIPAVNIGP